MFRWLAAHRERQARLDAPFRAGVGIQQIHPPGSAGLGLRLQGGPSARPAEPWSGAACARWHLTGVDVGMVGT